MYNYKFETEVWEEDGEFLYLVNQLFDDEPELLVYGSAATPEEALKEAGKAVMETFNV